MTGPLILFTAAFTVLIAAVTAVVIYVLHHPQRKTYAYALANDLPTDPAQLGLTFTEQRFRLTNGSSTVGWVIQGRQPIWTGDDHFSWLEQRPIWIVNTGAQAYAVG